LRGFYKKALHDKNENYFEIVKQEVDLSHPSHDGIQGKIWLTVQVMTQDEANVRQAAIGNYKDEPNDWPVLPKPDRPETSFNPLRIDKWICFYAKKFKGKVIVGCIICWVVLILALIIYLIVKFK